MGGIAADKPVIMKGSASKHVLNSIKDCRGILLKKKKKNENIICFAIDVTKGKIMEGHNSLMTLFGRFFIKCLFHN